MCIISVALSSPRFISNANTCFTDYLPNGKPDKTTASNVLSLYDKVARLQFCQAGIFVSGVDLQCTIVVRLRMRRLLL
jgi:hypothetical protein